MEKLDRIQDRFEYLQERIAGGDLGKDHAKLSKEYAELMPVVEKIAVYNDLVNELHAAESLAEDPEMKSLAEEDIRKINEELPKVEGELQLALVPSDSDDSKPAILEIRAGTGGEEAALFAGDLYRMYERFTEKCDWDFTPLTSSWTGLKGLKEAVVSIQGKSVFAKMKYESGVHRVQRVPKTESGGRIHTSAATVAVLPEADEIDIEIRDEDLKIETMRASGAGGQHVNTTDSAVRITHLPTGIVVTSSQKSQHQNKAVAKQVLRTRIMALETETAQRERASERKQQVGSGDRSERIRTYNFPQGRVTDHRINLTLHNLAEVLDGDLGKFISELAADDQARRLAAIES